MDSIFINSIIELYYFINPTMIRIPVNIYFTEDLNQKHVDLRPEYREMITSKRAEYANTQNGRMVAPHSVDDTICILMNIEKVKEYTDDRSMTWVGTIAHELTHAIDFYQMARRESLTFYDPLEDMSISSMVFRLWSEYHARKLGYKLFREYHNIMEEADDNQQIRHVVEVEWPYHKERHFTDYHSRGIDLYQQIYITMQLLGRYSVWCDLFPDVFSERALLSDYYHTPWLIHLFSFLRQHETLDKIYPYFDDFRNVLAENWRSLA